jgi:hypothetical protein
MARWRHGGCCGVPVTGWGVMFTLALCAAFWVLTAWALGWL